MWGGTGFFWLALLCVTVCWQKAVSCMSQQCTSACCAMACRAVAVVDCHDNDVLCCAMLRPLHPPFPLRLSLTWHDAAGELLLLVSCELDGPQACIIGSKDGLGQLLGVMLTPGGGVCVCVCGVQ